MIRRRNKLIKLRKERGLLQKDVTELLKDNYSIHISESYYGMIEQGTRTPKLYIALAIADLFNVDPQEIFFVNKSNISLPMFCLHTSA